MRGVLVVATVALSGLVAIVGTPPAFAQDDAVRHETAPQENVVPSGDIPKPGDDPEPAPDERELWRLLRRGSYGAVRREIDRIRAQNPGWEPSDQILSTLRAGERRWLIDRAIRENDDERLVRFARGYPREFNCRRIDWLWELAEGQWELDRRDEAVDTWKSIVDTCASTRHRLATLEKVHARAGHEEARRLLDRAVRNEREEDAFLDFRYRLDLESLGEAVEARELGHASSAAERLAGEIDARRDPTAATLAGWAAYENEKPERAAGWFRKARRWDPEREDATYGLVLSLRRSGNTREALRIARAEASTSPRLQDIFVELVTERARAEREAGRPAASLALLDEGTAVDPDARGPRLLRGWVLLDLGRDVEAARVFAELYDSHPDEESARGVTAAASRSEEAERLAADLATEDGPLASLHEANRARRMADRKLFTSAARLSHGGNVEHLALDPDDLRNVAAPSVDLEVAYRQKSGEDGLDELRLVHLPGAVARVFPVQGLDFEARLERVELDSDDPSPDALLGTPPGGGPAPFAFSPTTELENGVASWVETRIGTTTRLELAVGTTPTGGEVGIHPVGRLGLLHLYDAGRLSVAVFGDPVRESLLSTTGIVDPYTGRPWGRVVKSGLEVAVQHGIHEKWSVLSNATGAILTGQRVETNALADVGIGVRRAFAVPGLDYLVVGPQFFYRHFDENLSRFTFGHGGYFSPQRWVQGEIGMNFLTREAAPFVVRADASVGVQNHRQDRTPFFPEAPDGRFHPGDTVTSEVLSGEALGIFRLSPHWQLGGGISGRRTADFDEWAAFALVRFVFSPRPAIFSIDLPKTFDRLY